MNVLINLAMVWEDCSVLKLDHRCNYSVDGRRLEGMFVVSDVNCYLGQQKRLAKTNAYLALTLKKKNKKCN